MTKFTFDEAKARLALANRETLADHAFGDAEVYWMLDGKEIAGGYYGRNSSIEIAETVSRQRTEFHGKEAEDLRYCGHATKYERNDAQGDSL